MSEQRSISYAELAILQDFAADKYCYIGNEEEREQAIFDFVGRYIDGGKVSVFNHFNQFIADFDTLGDAIYYKEINEPVDELWSIDTTL